jgi:hypothetical protein
MSTLSTEDVGMMRAGNETRVGDWMETAFGHKFFPLDPRPEEVHLEDIAAHLARINRYNGAAKLECYSAAEHSVIMAFWLYREYGSEELAYQGLFHDAPEAYIGDMVRPLKRNMPAFVAAEAPVYDAIVEAFPILKKSHGSGQQWNVHNMGDHYQLDDRVHDADNRILVDERRQAMRPSPNSWGIDHLEPLGVRIHGNSANEAEARFLAAERYFRERLQPA